MRTPAREIFDHNGFLRSIDGNVDLFADLARLFVQECAVRLHSLRDALQRNDASALENAAHKLKGSVGYLCAANAYRAACDVEQAARAGDFSRARRACGRLERETLLLKEALITAGAANLKTSGSSAV